MSFLKSIKLARKFEQKLLKESEATLNCKSLGLGIEHQCDYCIDPIKACNASIITKSRYDTNCMCNEMNKDLLRCTIAMTKKYIQTIVKRGSNSMGIVYLTPIINTNFPQYKSYMEKLMSLM